MAVVEAPTGAGRRGPPAPVQQEGWWSRLVTFYHGVMAEMRKVTWPDVGQVRQATIAIIIFVLLIALLITVLDLALNGILVKLIPSLFAGR